MPEQIVWRVHYSDGSTCHFGNRAIAVASARIRGKVEEVRIKHTELSIVGEAPHNREADLESAGHRLALELECLLMDTKDIPTVSRWWESSMEALSAWRELHEYNGPRLGDS